MKRALPYILLGLVAFTIALLATVPARQGLAIALPQLEAQGVAVSGNAVSGTVWQGRVEGAVVNEVAVGDLRWSLSPWRLATGQVGLDWSARADDGFLEGWSRISRDGAVELSGLNGRLPLARLTRSIPGMPVTLGGELSVRLPAARLRNDQLEQLEGRLVWHGAEVVRPIPARLGDLAADVRESPDGGLVAELSDGGGPLSLEGQVTVSPDGRYQVNITIAARETAPPELTYGLAMLGRPDPRGRYAIRLNGRLW